ncbi:MAG: tetratricopeptide repeat protein [Candidatus Hydrogenedentes bacterium]|nr:tetratricopeptide repeat protein [Candidatus Hydrogenedentota bacterium]
MFRGHAVTALVTSMIFVVVAASGCGFGQPAAPSVNPADEAVLKASVAEAAGQMKADRHEDAAQRLEEAVAGLGKNPEPEFAAYAYTLLAEVRLHLKAHQEAADAAREAVAWNRKAGQDRSEHMARALSVLGQALLPANPEEARQLLLQAKSLAEEVKSRDAMLLMGIEDSLADALVRQGNIQAAEPHYQRALELQEQFDRNDTGRMVQALTNLGAYYQYLNLIDKSEGYFTRARTTLDSAGMHDSPEMARILSGEAFVKFRRGECSAAIDLLQQAIAVRTGTEVKADASLAKLYHDLGAAYECAGDRETAIAQYQASLEMFKTLQDPAAAHVQQRLDALTSTNFTPADAAPEGGAPPPAS